MLYQILGWLNVALLATITAPYWVRRLGQWLFPGKRAAIAKWIKPLRALHKPLGIAFAVLALIHGILALGALRLHTGSLVWILVLATATLGILFYRKKKAPLFRWHKRLALATVFLLLLHLIFPSALYYLF
ncbi:MAG TPA: hypothetical protein PKE04_16790 [Clostridia bacterium]|nr:hypothetical protein [Clostridia bacterium]